MIYAIGVHVLISLLCSFLYARKKRMVGLGDAWLCPSTFFLALVGGWIAVPEVWDTSWMDKYAESDDE